MENENVKYRNMTISLKVAAEEKIMLRRLAWIGQHNAVVTIDG